MSKDKNSSIKVEGEQLFDRVVSILEQARGNVVRAVNSNMVIAYWLIGREILEEIQGGEPRAEYGKQVLEELSGKLTNLYGSGFSVTNLKYFRTFYQAYQGRINSIRHLSGDELSITTSDARQNRRIAELASIFNPDLSWSHYRALMRVKNERARSFYEKEAGECGWSKVQLERQIQTSYYERISKNKTPNSLLPEHREQVTSERLSKVHALKSPYVLEFLDLPNTPILHESDIEQAIIHNLQSFLLELGKGFSFVARQKRIRIDEDDFYIDLVFYNYILKCFVLIDLKVGKLTHGAVGQMDGYVRLFEDIFKGVGDNPTIGLILCSNKSEAVAKYSVLAENRQIFASRYLQFLPTEHELEKEIEKERRLIEAVLRDKNELEEL